jgi:hypothetical protein
MQRMQHTIEMAMAEKLVQMDAECKAALDEAINSFDYAKEIRESSEQVIKHAIRWAIERQFDFEAAGYEAIQNVARQLVANAFKDLGGNGIRT